MRIAWPLRHITQLQQGNILGISPCQQLTMSASVVRNCWQMRHIVLQTSNPLIAIITVHLLWSVVRSKFTGWCIAYLFFIGAVERIILEWRITEWVLCWWEKSTRMKITMWHWYGVPMTMLMTWWWSTVIMCVCVCVCVCCHLVYCDNPFWYSFDGTNTMFCVTLFLTSFLTNLVWALLVAG